MVINALREGHQEFKKNQSEDFKDELKRLVVEGQQPEILFIGCSDSRVTPDLMLGTKPGDMFVLRNVGNFVPPFKHDYDFHGSSAAIEFAISILKVKHIIVCGHSYCGACKSLYEDIPNDDSLIHVKNWLKLGAKAKEKTLKDKKFSTKEEMYRITERNSIRHQLESLMTYPAIAKLANEDKITIHGWYYDIETGNIDVYNKENDQFNPIEKWERECQITQNMK